MIDYFIKNKFNYLNRDLDYLWYRIDLDRDGRVSYSEVRIVKLLCSLMKKLLLKLKKENTLYE